MPSSFNRNPATESVAAFILRAIRREDAESIAQPFLIVGEDGCGKSSLLKTLSASLHELGFDILPVAGRRVFSNNDLQRCFEQKSRRAVLLWDDFQYYLKRTGSEQHYALRGMISRPGAPVMIATIDTLPQDITDYKAAFFDAFNIQYVKNLTVGQMAGLLEGQERKARVSNLMLYLPATIRSLQIAVDIVNMSENPDEDLKNLLSWQSDRYRLVFDMQTVQSQRILISLAESENGLPLSELKVKTGQTGGALTPYLQSLVSKRVIVKESGDKRGTSYHIVDPLFRSWVVLNSSLTES